MRQTEYQWLQWSVLRLHHLPVLGPFLRLVCCCITWFVGQRLAHLPGVIGVFLRHSHPASPTFVPGHSDLDLTIVFADAAADDPRQVSTCARRLEQLNRRFFFLCPQDARFTARSELTCYSALPGSIEILNQPAAWTRIGGAEVRHTPVQPLPPERLPWHPEFNRWWAHVLQTHLLMPQQGVEERFLRMFYRVALKCQLHLQAARDGVTPYMLGYVQDVLPPEAFREAPELLELLLRLREQHFWTDEPEALKARIFLSILHNVRDFYRDQPQCPKTEQDDTSLRHLTDEVPIEAHYAELQQRIEAQPTLTAILEAVLVYPSPHWYPYEYQVDCILRDDLAVEELVAAVRTLRQAFQGRTFGVQGTHAQLTLIPRSVFSHPLYFVGMPYPFLCEHIRAYGTQIFGTPIAVPRSILNRSELLTWGRMYLYYHMFSLRRRPTYVAKDCNFYQLASLRLFLETGEIMTDARQIRQAYCEMYGAGPLEQTVIDFFLNRSTSQPSGHLYAAAFTFLTTQYEQVEAFLQRQELT